MSKPHLRSSRSRSPRRESDCKSRSRSPVLVYKKIVEQEKSSLFDYFSCCKVDLRKINSKEFEIIEEFFDDDLDDLDEILHLPLTLFEITRNYDNYLSILKKIKCKDTFLSPKIFDILLSEEFIKDGDPVIENKFLNELLELLQSNKSKDFFIFKTIFSYHDEGKEHNHIFLIHYNKKSNTFTIINTVEGFINNIIYFIDKDTSHYTGNSQRNIIYLLKFSLIKISKELQKDENIVIELISFPYIQEAESKIYGIKGGLCQIWSLFFIYYYCNGFDGQEKLSALHEILYFFKRINKPELYTKILAIWFYTKIKKINQSKFKPKTKKLSKIKSKKLI